jgi:hypothetical protein
MLIHRRSSELEPRRRKRTSRQSSSTEFGDQRTVGATPRHRQSPAEIDIAGKVRHHSLDVLPLVPSRTMHRGAIAAFAIEPPPAKATVSRASLDQQPRLDQRIPLRFN